MDIVQGLRLFPKLRIATCISCVALGLTVTPFSAHAQRADSDGAQDGAGPGMTAAPDRDSGSHRLASKWLESLREMRLAHLDRLTNLSSWNRFPDAEEFTDQATNLAVLLQTLDQDGDLNNDIDISRAAARIVSEYEDTLTLDQPPAEFARSTAVTQMMAELNAAGTEVFDDTDPRDRRPVNAEDAVELVARAQSDRRLVKTSLGLLRGFTTPDEKAWSFYGIPYAQPPLGDLRWKPPVPHEGWRGVREAIAWGDQAAQSPTNEAFGEGGMSEDSLYLNVTVPKDAGDEPLPVMVWFHGGGFAILTGNTKGFNNTSLPAAGTVVVTVNHRLGPFGYMAHPALTAESQHGASGNYGQLDLIAALEWVQENIDRFGGDPDNVTIFGESGGGGKTLSLLHSPLAEGLFHKAIVQSGMAAPLDPTIPVDNPLEAQEAQGERLAEALGVADEPAVLAAMRDIPWPEVVEAAAESRFAARPNIDGWYTTMSIRDAFEAGVHHDVPIMAGANTGDLPPLVEGLKWYMPWMAEYNESDVYAYVFDHVPEGWRNFGTPAYHGVELVYMFDYPGSFVAHYLLGLTGHEDPTIEKFATVDNPGVNPEEYARVSGLSVAMWASFAEDGDPSVPAQDWPAYTGSNDTYLRIDLTPAAETGLDEAFPEMSFPGL